MLELAVLGLLKEQPLHGYELKKRLGEMLGAFWGVSFGSLYPALRRLERAGAIAVVTGDATAMGGPTSRAVPATGSVDGEAAAARLRLVAGATGRRARKAYRITPAGERHFAELLAADDDGDDERLFSLKLAFCRHLDPAARLALLERRRAELTDRLARARRSRGPALDRYTRSLVEHRTSSTELDLAWVDDLIRAERDALDTPTRKGASA
ncbi:MAG: PadR family transcriptional regulator [Actinobacteria bacterium]|nr:PadR family transcriptional regulator [Actinomycetota bacterium]